MLSPCFLRDVPHRQIVHPMPFYLIFGLSDCPKIRAFGIPENPEFRVFRNAEIPLSETQDFGTSENPDFQISGLPNLRKSGFTEIGFPIPCDPWPASGGNSTRVLRWFHPTAGASCDYTLVGK